MSYNPLRPIAMSDRIMYIACRAAVVASISKVPQEGSPAFSLFYFIKLHFPYFCMMCDVDKFGLVDQN